MPSHPEKSLEQIVKETGRYPVEAFLFVQECLGVAADKVHGPLSAEERAVVQWIAHHGLSPEELRSRFEEGDLPPDIRQTLDRIGGPRRLNRHVSGQQLCWAIRDVALERWGLMARGVLARWNITRTEDIGGLIFALVNNGWLQKQPTDSIADFDGVFLFDQAFDEAYQIEQN